jgi:hypothetical protein
MGAGFAILEITDGITTIDLLDRSGIRVKDWAPVAQQYKGGGVRNDSAMAHGSAVVMSKEQNTEDTFALVARGANEDTLYTNIRALLGLLEQAVHYWTTTWQSEPVWIKAKGPRETNARYAIITNYAFPGIANPVAQSIFLCFHGSWSEVALTLEHGVWQDVAIGLDSCVEASGGQLAPSYGNAWFGQEATCLNSVFIANKANLAQLTHIKRYRVAGAQWWDMMGVALPRVLLGHGGTVADGDMIYFGIDLGTYAVCPFSSLVFDVEVAAVYVGAAICYWEYWNGAWVHLHGVDDTVAVGAATVIGAAGTLAFSRAGVNSVAWQQPADWTTTAVNGVAGWWVRVRASIPGGGDSITQTQQQNREIYTVLWPYIEIAAAEIYGDVPARGRIRLNGRMGGNVLDVTGNNARRVVMGLRTKARDWNPNVTPALAFHAYLNASDLQQPTGLTHAIGATMAYVGASGAISDAATGRETRETLGALASDYMQWTLSPYLAYAYRGTFHAYLRYKDVPAGVAGYPFTARLLVGQSAGYYDWSSSPVALYKQAAAAASRIYVADLGLVRLPLTSPLKAPSRWSGSVILSILLSEVAGVGDAVDIFDLVLIPADEWLCDVSANMSNANEGLSVFDYLDIDSVTMPYYHTVAHKRDTGRASATPYADYDKSSWPVHASEPVLFQVNADQRLWFLALGRYNTPSVLEFFGGQHMLQSVKLTGARRYLVTRGDG